MPDVNACTRLAAEQAYEMAGVGPEDINLSNCTIALLPLKCFIMKIWVFVKMEMPVR